MKLPLRIGFPWLTLIVVALSAWLAYDLNLGGKSYGFYGSRGFPFVWYTWTDCGPPFQTYNETALMWNLVLAAAFLSWLAFAMEWLRRRRLGPGTVAAMIVAAVMSLFVQLMPQEGGLFAHLPQYRLGSRGMPLQWHAWNIERPDRHGYDWRALTADLTLALGAVLVVGVVAELARRRTLGPPKNDQTSTEPAAKQPRSPIQASTF